jgi:hypothetical protein
MLGVIFLLKKKEKKINRLKLGACVFSTRVLEAHWTQVLLTSQFLYLFVLLAL